MKSDSPVTRGLFTPLPEKRTFKEIERQIRQLIYSKALKPGDRLPNENELAAQFKAGRLSVREALRMLEQAGLIVVKQGSTGGSYVRELDATVAVESIIDLMWQGDVRVRDMTDARSAVETLILEKAFHNMTEDDILALAGFVEELETLVAGGGQREFPVDPTLTNFHLAIARATKNPIFLIILKVLMELTTRVMTPATVGVERLRKHALSHRLIFDALKKRDLQGAMRAMQDHMLEVENRYADRLSQEDGGKGGTS
jgi:GntR family transcriptional regulator, transcriptional repressor for pyruvate dehydrogenase complex